MFGLVARGDLSARNLHYAAAVFEGSHWFDAASLLGGVGIIVGVAAGLITAVSWRALAPTAVIFGGALLLFYGGMDIAAWYGVVLYAFCLVGGAYVGRSLRGTKDALPAD
ncbi:MAG TPA: hypothetical protein VGJ81_13785 [Thermoanaerobaculia bacterium]|jgi:hypothetical protein